MGKISKGIGANKLDYTVRWYFSKENLDEANRRILHVINNLSLPKIYNKNKNQLHTSSDGQKFSVGVPSLHSRYSYKYFGFGKGVSAYSFVDEQNKLFYSTIISTFISASKYIRRITEYMHRFWIPQQINDNPENVDVKELNLLVLCRWDDLVLQRVELLMPVLLDLINQSRQGDNVDWQVLAGVIRSFVTIGSANAEQPVQLYTDTFETKFLKRTQQFYKKASTNFLGEVCG